MWIFCLLWTALTHFTQKSFLYPLLNLPYVIAVTAYFLLYKSLFQVFFLTTATCLLLLTFSCISLNRIYNLRLFKDCVKTFDPRIYLVYQGNGCKWGDFFVDFFPSKFHFFLSQLQLFENH